MSMKKTSVQCQVFLKNLGPKFKDQGHHMNMDCKNAVLEPQLHSNILGSNICASKNLAGGLLSISENLRSKGQKSPHD